MFTQLSRFQVLDKIASLENHEALCWLIGTLVYQFLKESFLLETSSTIGSSFLVCFFFFFGNLTTFEEPSTPFDGRTPIESV